MGISQAALSQMEAGGEAFLQVHPGETGRSNGHRRRAVALEGVHFSETISSCFNPPCRGVCINSGDSIFDELPWSNDVGILINLLLFSEDPLELVITDLGGITT